MCKLECDLVASFRSRKRRSKGCPVFFMCLIAVSVAWATKSVDWFGRSPARASLRNWAVTVFSLMRRNLWWSFAMTLLSRIMRRSDISVFRVSGSANDVCHPLQARSAPQLPSAPSSRSGRIFASLVLSVSVTEPSRGKGFLPSPAPPPPPCLRVRPSRPRLPTRFGPCD